MRTKLHTMAQARAAKRAVCAATSDLRGVSVGIGETADGRDYAVVVLVDDEATRRQLPRLQADVPVEVTVAGRVKAL
jgi:hypothetical protein